MVKLDLSTEEIAALRETLESTLSELRYEINDTDSHDYKAKLRQKQASLEKALEQLSKG
jgi:ElaB/YqjD/DUF883 family membrane-anchored ribosome-binding protein